MFIKNKIKNLLIKNGNKRKSEIILKNSIKIFQKTLKKCHTHAIALAINNSMPSLGTVEQKKRKNVRKNKQKISYFPYVLNAKIRVRKSILNIVTNLNNEKIQESLFKNVLKLSSNKSVIKDEIQESHKKIILQKKKAKFRWFY